MDEFRKAAIRGNEGTSCRLIIMGLSWLISPKSQPALCKSVADSGSHRLFLLLSCTILSQTCCISKTTGLLDWLPASQTYSRTFILKPNQVRPIIVPAIAVACYFECVCEAAGLWLIFRLDLKKQIRCDIHRTRSWKQKVDNLLESAANNSGIGVDLGFFDWWSPMIF